MKRILVIDDDADVLGLLKTILEDAYEVAHAQSGVEGLELARRLRPDLIVLDLLMPSMHGYEVCRRIRQDASLKDMKILISSSKSYPHDVRTAIEETGADGYMVKPFDLAEFRRRVDELVAKR